MERSTQKNGLINLLALLVVGVADFAVARYSNSLAGQVGAFFLGLGLLVAAVSWFQMRLEEKVRIEKLEFEELAKGRGSAALFEAKDSEVFPVRRSREQFERFFIPIFTVLLCVMQAGGAFLLWRWLPKSLAAPEVKEWLTAMAFFLVSALVLFLLGRFSVTFARLENNRLLRPSASYVLFNAFLCAAVGVGIVFIQCNFPKADFIVAHILCGLMALIAIETLVSLVLEVYRPRVKGKVERPLYESRLVGLLGQPEGLITTAADALDYQFGFKVSETWFYRLFFQKALKWLILLQAVALVLSTTVVFIDAGEQGVIERFGRRQAVLDAGIHGKWPWPIDKVYRHSTEQIQTLNIGSTPDPEAEKGKVVLWAYAHNSEENFLVANRDRWSVETTNQTAGKRIPPVSLITGSIPIQFQITNVVDWAYNNEDSPSLLHDIASREVVRFMVSADMTELVSYGRLEACQTLADRIQTAALSHHMGVKILCVGLQDLHPPVKVAKDYENVIGAAHSKQARILAAQADGIRTNNMAQAQAASLTNQACAESISRRMGALAQAALFTNQIPAFLAAPEVYSERLRLQTFVRATANARKYVLLTTNTHEVLTFDLQEKFRKELLEDLSVTPPNK